MRGRKFFFLYIDNNTSFIHWVFHPTKNAYIICYLNIVPMTTFSAKFLDERIKPKYFLFLGLDAALEGEQKTPQNNNWTNCDLAEQAHLSFGDIFIFLSCLSRVPSNVFIREFAVQCNLEGACILTFYDYLTIVQHRKSNIIWC